MGIFNRNKSLITLKSNPAGNKIEEKFNSKISGFERKKVGVILFALAAVALLIAAKNIIGVLSHITAL